MLADEDPRRGLGAHKAIHVALGVRADDTKEVLSLWLEQNESAKFWLRVMNEYQRPMIRTMCPIAQSDGHDAPGLIDEVVPASQQWLTMAS